MTPQSTELRESSIAVLLRAKAPWLGIPVTGQRPFVLKRSMVQIALNDGMQFTDIELTQDESGARRLTVRGYSKGSRTARIKRRYTFNDFAPSSLYDVKCMREAQAKWALSQRTKLAKPADKTEARKRKLEAQIAKIERERAKLYAHRPHNPLILKGKYHLPTEYEREQCLAWQRTRERRKQLSRIAGLAINGEIGVPKFYKLAREAGFDVRHYSELRTYQREQVTDAKAYLQSVYKFTYGLRERPFRRVDHDSLPEHREHLISYLHDVHLIQDCDNRIASIREMLCRA